MLTNNLKTSVDFTVKDQFLRQPLSRHCQSLGRRTGNVAHATALRSSAHKWPHLFQSLFIFLFYFILFYFILFYLFFSCCTAWGSSYSYTYTFFFLPFVLLQYVYLAIVLNVTQQDLLVNLF